jgi:hypothetical protein
MHFLFHYLFIRIIFKYFYSFFFLINVILYTTITLQLITLVKATNKQKKKKSRAISLYQVIII